jgi:hypothetical protein
VPAPPRLRFRRAEPRLDPVRWRRPGRGTLLRMIAVAALLTVGAAAAWSRQPGCAPPAATARAPSTGAGHLTGTAAGPSPSWPVTTTEAARPAPGDQGGHPVPPGRVGDQGGHPVPPGRVGVPVRLAEPTALALIHPGDRVDLLRVDGTTRRASAVAVGAPVLDVTGADDPTTGGLLLALRPDEAQSAVTGPDSGFAVLVRPD